LNKLTKLFITATSHNEARTQTKNSNTDISGNGLGEFYILIRDIALLGGAIHFNNIFLKLFGNIFFIFHEVIQYRVYFLCSISIFHSIDIAHDILDITFVVLVVVD